MDNIDFNYIEGYFGDTAVTFPSANENTFKIIDIEMLILQHKQGHLSETQLLEMIGMVVNEQCAIIEW